MEGFTLRCSKCGEQVEFNKPNFYSKQWDGEGCYKKIKLGVNWHYQEVEIECKCGNKVIEE